MRTLAWTPAPSLISADFAIDDEIIFAAYVSKIEKRLPLLAALLVAAAYATENLPFELRNRSQEVLAVFEPGQPIQGYPSIVQAMLDVAAHLDHHAQRAVVRIVDKLKEEAVNVYERGVYHGIEAEQRRVAQEVEDAGNEASRRAEAERETSEFAALSSEAPAALPDEAPPAEPTPA